MSSFKEIDKPIIYLITKGNLNAENFQTESRKTLKIIKAALLAKVNVIQIREKDLSSKLLLEFVRMVVGLKEKTGTKILVNERFDVAIAANADGVHLTSNSMPINAVRRCTDKDFIIGVSTHSVEKVKKAAMGGADFVTFSPIFDTTSKSKFLKAKGLGELKEVCELSDPFPIVALGGINKNNYKKTLDAGASGFAGISFLNDTDNLGDLGSSEV